MKDDPIVAEVRKIREEMLASYGGDYQRMLRDMMKRQWESGHPVVSLVGGELVAAAKPKVAEAGADYGAKERAK